MYVDRNSPITPRYISTTNYKVYLKVRRLSEESNSGSEDSEDARDGELAGSGVIIDGLDGGSAGGGVRRRWGSGLLGSLGGGSLLGRGGGGLLLSGSGLLWRRGGGGFLSRGGGSLLIITSGKEGLDVDTSTRTGLDGFRDSSCYEC